MARQERPLPDWIIQCVADGADTIAIDMGTRVTVGEDKGSIKYTKLDVRSSISSDVEGAVISLHKKEGLPDTGRWIEEVQRRIEAVLSDNVNACAIRLRSTGYDADKRHKPVSSWQDSRENITGNPDKQTVNNQSLTGDLFRFVSDCMAKGIPAETAEKMWASALQHNTQITEKPDRAFTKMIMESLQDERKENSAMRAEWREGYKLALSESQIRAVNAENRAREAEDRARLLQKDKSDTAQTIEALGNAIAKSGIAGQTTIAGASAAFVAALSGGKPGEAFLDASNAMQKDLTKEVA